MNLGTERVVPMKEKRAVFSEGSQSFFKSAKYFISAGFSEEKKYCTQK
jgi:hypothetical protein